MKIDNISKRKKIFIRFLKEKNLYSKFFTNYKMKNNSSIVPLESLIDYIIRYNNMFCYNNQCTEMMLFDWNETKEGFSFWSNENKSWVNVVNLIINK